MSKELFLSLAEAFTALKDFSSEHLAFGFVSGSTLGSLNCSSQMLWSYVKLGWQALGITKHLLTVLKLKLSGPNSLSNRLLVSCIHFISSKVHFTFLTFHPQPQNYLSITNAIIWFKPGYFTHLRVYTVLSSHQW